MPTPTVQPPRSVVSRINAILSTFRSGSRHSVTEIARMTGLPMSTTHRLAADLAAWQLLERMPDGDYRIGITLQMLTGEAACLPLLQERGPAALMDLHEATGRRARLGVLVDGRVSYVEKRVGADPITPFSPRASLPAHATALGKALLAFASPAVVAAAAEDLTVYTARTVATPDRLRRTLTIVRTTRIAVACGELVAGDTAVAAPVFGRGGEAVAALELQVCDLRTELEVSRAVLAVVTAGLSRELALDASRADRPHLRVLAPPIVPIRSASGT